MSAHFAAGDPVRVRPAAKPGHVRTPAYLKGKAGRVERVIGDFRNPEDLAYGLSGSPEKTLYRVFFLQRDLWDDYEGSAADSLSADVYEHWLEAEGEST